MCICDWRVETQSRFFLWVNRVKRTPVIHFFFQNTALHIAAANGHASVVTLLLSHPISEITFNTTSDNILDVAVKEKRSTVVMAIAENDRLLSQYDHKCLFNNNDK